MAASNPSPGPPSGPGLRVTSALDPLLGLVWALVLLVGGMALAQRRPAAPASAAASGLPARIAEAQAFARALRPSSAPAFERLSGSLVQPWDRAVASVLAAEAQEAAGARRLALEGVEPAGAGAAFRAAFREAYGDGGPSALRGEEPAVFRALGAGYAARLLEARLLERRGDASRAQALREAARKAMGRRFLGFAALGSTVLVLGVAGAAFGIFLTVTRKVPPRLELGPSPLDGRSLAWLFGLWILALLLSGTVVEFLLRLAPGLRPFTLPMAYSLQAAAGLGLLAALEGRGLRPILARLGSRAPLRALGWAAGFLALAVTLVILVALVLAPLLRSAPPPQRELLELIRGSRGLLTTALLFLTVAGLAPCWEELLFRGTLQPWLQTRLGPAWAIPLAAFAFAAIHLQPLATPALFTLGAVLGLAARRTGSLLAPVAVHAAWNGGVFLVMKILA